MRMMSQYIRIFGYGSLMSQRSLRATVPSACDIESAKIEGFLRSFNFWDKVGYTETNRDVSGEPMCALNIQRSISAATVVTGVTFMMHVRDLGRLLLREDGYNMIEVAAIPFGQVQGRARPAFAFAAPDATGTYKFGGSAQQRYLEDFLGAAAEYGELFFQETILNTMIDGFPLTAVADLLPTLQAFGPERRLDVA